MPVAKPWKRLTQEEGDGIVYRSGCLFRLQGGNKLMTQDTCGPLRLPLYVLVDVSASMAGGGLEATRGAIDGMLQRLRINKAAKTVHLAVVTFASAAMQTTPLTSVMALESLHDLGLDDLEPSGSSAFGEALKLLKESVTHELKFAGQPDGDGRPLVVIFTDGDLSDDWTMHVDVLRDASVSMIFWGDDTAQARRSAFRDQMDEQVAGVDYETFQRMGEVQAKILAAANHLAKRGHTLDYPQTY